MTNSEIKQELRRSACEDKDPWSGVKEGEPFDAAGGFCWRDEKYMLDMKPNQLRFFFLLVAEAL